MQITGEVRLRDESTYTPALPTGEVELAVSHMEVLSTADTLPFSLTDEEPVREEVRLKYRYLDLRRPQMYRNPALSPYAAERGAAPSQRSGLFSR